jgi:hypothetical protein
MKQIGVDVNRRWVIGVAVVVSGLCAMGGPLEETATQANALYEAGKKDEAKVLYQQLAEQGFAEGHFRLAYQYILEGDQGRDHFIAAARLGHQEALGYALDELLFRANGLRAANPSLAMEVYQQARKANPQLELYDEAAKLKTMELCLKAPPFDVDAFMAKYGIEDEDDEYPFYDVWELAEEASHGGRFGTPDPGLVFNLVIRGGLVPAEFQFAVEETHANYVQGVIRPFDICDYASSGIGVGYCAGRAYRVSEKERLSRVDQVAARHPNIHSGCIRLTYTAFSQFIDFKTDYEEGHGGSGRSAWILDSEVEQKDAFLDRLESLLSGTVPSVTNEAEAVRSELVETLQQTLELLDAQAEPREYVPSAEQVMTVHRQWHNYVEIMGHLMLQIHPSVDESFWKTWLAGQRMEQLKAVQQLVRDY